VSEVYPQTTSALYNKALVFFLSYPMLLSTQILFAQVVFFSIETSITLLPKTGLRGIYLLSLGKNFRVFPRATTKPKTPIKNQKNMQFV